MGQFERERERERESHILLFEAIIKFSFKYNCWVIGIILLIIAARYPTKLTSLIQTTG